MNWLCNAELKCDIVGVVCQGGSMTEFDYALKAHVITISPQKEVRGEKHSR